MRPTAYGIAFLSGEGASTNSVLRTVRMGMHHYDAANFNVRLHPTFCAFVHFNRITLYRQRKRHRKRLGLLRGQILRVYDGEVHFAG